MNDEFMMILNDVWLIRDLCREKEILDKQEAGGETSAAVNLTNKLLTQGKTYILGNKVI